MSSDKQTLLALAERVERHSFDGRWDMVTDRSRELNEAIAVAQDLPLTQELGDPALGNYRRVPARVQNYVGSLDAAMLLVPEADTVAGEKFRLEVYLKPGVLPAHVRASAWVPGAPRVYAATPALALTAASLRARAGAMV